MHSAAVSVGEINVGCPGVFTPFSPIGEPVSVKILTFVHPGSTECLRGADGVVCCGCNNDISNVDGGSLRASTVDIADISNVITVNVVPFVLPLLTIRMTTTDPSLAA